MKRFAVTFAVIAVLVSFTSFVSAAEDTSKCLKWTHPGRDANQRTLEGTVHDLDLPTMEDEIKVLAVMNRAVVRIEPILAEINKLGDKIERERLTKLVRATKKQLFAKEAIENLGLPQEMVQTILVSANLDTSLYQAEAVGAGYKTGEMVFGKDKKADCVILQPAPGQPQEIVIHHFAVLLSDGNVWDIDHSTICSNMAKKGKRPGKKAAAPAPPASPTPTSVVFKAPHEGFTNRVVVWEILADPKKDFARDPKGALADKIAFLNAELKLKGKHSRQFGNVIRESVANGRLELYKASRAKFEIEFHDLNWDAALGTKLGVNNQYQFQPGLVIPATFGPGQNTLELEVIGGEGQVTIEKKIVLPATSVVVRALGDLPVVHPENRTLYTCVEDKTRKKCGGEEMGRYYRVVQERDDTRFNFFVIRQ